MVARVTEASQDKFLQPVISTVGLVISTATALTPLISQGPTIQLFLDRQLAIPSSFLAFLFAAIMVWVVTEHYRYIYVNFGQFKDRGKGFSEYKFSIDNKRAILILTFLCIVLAFSFFGIHLFGDGSIKILSIVQSLCYVFFFMLLTAIFSNLYVNTQDRYKYDERRREISRLLFDTLSKNGIISSGLSLIENRPLTRDETVNLGISGFMNKYVRVRTVKQEDEVIDVVTSSDGVEIIKLLKKQKLK